MTEGPILGESGGNFDTRDQIVPSLHFTLFLAWIFQYFRNDILKFVQYISINIAANSDIQVSWVGDIHKWLFKSILLKHSKIRFTSSEASEGWCVCRWNDTMDCCQRWPFRFFLELEYMRRLNPKYSNYSDLSAYSAPHIRVFALQDSSSSDLVSEWVTFISASSGQRQRKKPWKVHGHNII